MRREKVNSMHGRSKGKLILAVCPRNGRRILRGFYVIKRLVIFCLFVASSCAALSQSGGGLFFNDIRPLIAQKPELFKRILRDFTIFFAGDARMINRSESTALNGERIGPYHFYAKPKEAQGPFTYDLEIDTKVTFYKKGGLQETSLANASELKEEVVNICIRPVQKEEYFEPMDDQVEDQREFERKMTERASGVNRVPQNETSAVDSRQQDISIMQQYLSNRKGWNPSEYKIERSRQDGRYTVYLVTYSADQRIPSSERGNSFEVYYDPSTHTVFKERRFQ
jgi:hypothetical protein